MIFTQPLYVRNLTIAGAQHNVIFVATENDSVYALDAQDPTQILWQRSFIDTANGITPADGNFGGRTGMGPFGVTDTSDRSFDKNNVPLFDDGREWRYFSSLARP